MAKEIPPALFQGEAYRLYHTEFQLRINELDRYLSGEVGAPSCDELRTRFHMLKGGAGFFGFDEVYRLAGELEKFFAKGEEEPESLTLKSACETLKRHCREMPPPVGGTHA